MIVRKIDSVGDWTFGKGKNSYLTEVDAIAQSIKTRLQSFLGDCFFAQDQGIDWFNLLGSKKQTELALSMSSVLLNTDGVTKIVDFAISLNRNTRNLLVNYEVITIYGNSTNSFQLDLGV